MFAMLQEEGSHHDAIICMTTPIRVFISYSWDSEEHKQRVLELAQRLRREGVDARLDRLTGFPSEGWEQWMANQVEEAAFVLVVATDLYRTRFERKALPGTGLGATWEGSIITQEIYEEGARTTKFVPITLVPTDAAHIPTPLRGFNRYSPSDEEGYDALYRLLTGQPALVPEVVGSVRRRESSTGVGGGIGSVVETAEPPSRAPLPVLPVRNHALPRNNLPLLPFFFGREEELKKIADALAPETRSWGALIDGPGGMGKTSLAIRAAELSPPRLFHRIVFLSAKEREMTPDGEQLLAGFALPGWLEMLNELARQLDKSELARSLEEERTGLLLRALADENALLIFDNLESLPASDRDRLFTFLARLPRGCKAIVTSRRRNDIDARIVRLEELGQDAALAFIADLAQDRPRLANSTEAEREALHRETGGNPLLIRWLVGQLGRGKCSTIAAALDLLRSTPPENDPLEFVFGDLVEAFTASETRVLGALAHFSELVELKFIAQLAGLSAQATQGAVDGLVNRALVISDGTNERFRLVLLVVDFLRNTCPDAIKESGDRLADRVFALVIQNGMNNYCRFPKIEAEWFFVAAALPIYALRSNSQLQAICEALDNYFECYGHWDEWLALSSEAESEAMAARDFVNAALRAKTCGWVYYLRGQSDEVRACADRAIRLLPRTKSGNRVRSSVIQLRGIAYELQKNYPAALADYRSGLEMTMANAPKSVEVAIYRNMLGYAERLSGDFLSASRSYREALRVAKTRDNDVMVAIISGNLADLALAQEIWTDAELLSRKALIFAEKVGRKDLMAWDCRILANALARLGRKVEAVPHARRAVDLYANLGSRHVTEAQDTLRECES